MRKWTRWEIDARREIKEFPADARRLIRQTADKKRTKGLTRAFRFPVAYQALATFQQGGLPALMPQKRGPRQAHKLTAEVLAFLRQIRQKDVSLRPAALAFRIQDRYGITVHPRSIERALVRSQKKTP